MIKCKKFSEKNREEWEKFIDGSTNGTIFHYRKFIDYHETPPFEDSSLLFYKNDTIVAVLPAAIKNNQFVSHPGISFGGFVHGVKLSYLDASNIIEAFKGFIDSHSYKKVINTFPPNYYSKTISHYIEF